MGFQAREAEASTLLDADGQPLDSEVMQGRPGFAAFIDTQNYIGEPRVITVCLDPEAWGYTRTVRTSYVGEAEMAQKAAAEQAQAEYKEALLTATTVRREFLIAQYATVRAAKKVYPEALRAAVSDYATIEVTDEFAELAHTLAGLPTTLPSLAEAAAGAGMDRLIRLMVARWLSAQERNLTSLSLHRAWNVSRPRAIGYLDRLTDAGYTLSDAEQRLYDDISTYLAHQATEAAEAARAEQDGDEDDSASTDEQTDDDEEDSPATGTASDDTQDDDEGDARTEHPHGADPADLNTVAAFGHDLDALSEAAGS